MLIGIFIIFCGVLYSILHNLAIEGKEISLLLQCTVLLLNYLLTFAESVTIIHHFGIQLKRKYILGREKIQVNIRTIK